MPHFAIYVRRSYKRMDAASVSDETQEQMARALLPPDATWEVITDTGGHRSGATTERDGYQDLLAKLRAGRIDGIAVYDLSRLHRNAANMLALRAELERRQVALLVDVQPTDVSRSPPLTRSRRPVNVDRTAPADDPDGPFVSVGATPLAPTSSSCERERGAPPHPTSRYQSSTLRGYWRLESVRGRHSNATGS